MGRYYIKEIDSIFVHIPKCGGTSIRGTIDNVGAFGSKASTCSGYDSHSNAFKFTFVRNPYDRIVSAWKMAISGTSTTNWVQTRYNSLKICVNEKNQKFGEFLNYVTYLTTLNSSDMNDTQAAVYMHTRPMLSTLTRTNVPISDLDFTGRFETLESDFKTLCKLRSVERTLPKLNVTEHAHYSTYYTPKLYKIVSALYEEDLKTFNYKFEEE